ncbi:hypothetical protein BGX26_000198 [Mortierella sp. AD094]|nr:hypothetical protein BGX26_000198 [Mortierella sp. AD094]
MYRSINHLPEHALNAIVQSLRSSELSACALVSKAWSQIFTKALWKDLHVAQGRPEIGYTSSEFKCALATYGHHIRTLRLEYYTPLESFFTSPCPLEPLKSSPTDSPPPLSSLPSHTRGWPSSLEVGNSETKVVVCKNLESLTMANIAEVMLEPIDESLLVQFLQQISSSLKILSLSPFSCNRVNFLRVTTDCLPNLQGLYLTVIETPREKFVRPAEFELFLQRLPPQVQDATLILGMQDKNSANQHIRYKPKLFPYRLELFPGVGDGDNSGLSEGLSAENLLLGIKKLTIGGALSRDIAPEMLLNFFRRCPVLESLILDEFGFHSYLELAKMFRNYCPCLAFLEVRVSRNYINNIQVAYLLVGSAKGWKRFSLYGMRNSFDIYPSVLVLCVRVLERLDLPKVANLPNTLIPAMLGGAEARNLRRLDLLGSITNKFTFAIGTELNAQDLLVLAPQFRALNLSYETLLEHPFSQVVPFQCLNLVYLRIKITGIPRPDLLTFDERQDIEADLDWRTGPKLQRQVLTQIGRLVHLEELAFGNKDDRMPKYKAKGSPVIDARHHQFDCLSLGLQYGLASMKDLKKLHVLDVSWMMHSIEESEPIWMNTHWERLSKIHGLAPLGVCTPTSATVRWLKQNRVDWVQKVDLDEWRAVRRL